MAIPSTVWRVQPDTTPRKYLKPRSMEFDIEDLSNLRRLHNSWGLNFDSPFLSAFSNREHAINWGRIHCPDGILYEIDATQKKNQNKIFEGLQPHEYLIVGKIRSTYILNTARVADIPRPFRPKRESRDQPLQYYAEAEGNFRSEADAQEAIDIASWMEYDH